MDKNSNPRPLLPIMLADGEILTLKTYEKRLIEEGFNNFILCSNAEESLEFLKEKKASLIIFDLDMRGASDGNFLDKLICEHPEAPVIIATSRNNISTVVESIKRGAHDYLLKPIDWTRFMVSVRNALKLRNLETENIRLKNSLLESNIRNFQPYQKIVSDTDAMFSIFLYIDSISVTSQPVLITGETGTGKELIAEAVHIASGRKGKFVSINVAGLDDSAFSDTLFGHKAGAFTDAREARKGLIENAAGGTLFLDEIGDLKENSQIKLLRLIQENEYYPLGADAPVKANARIVTASNKNLLEMKDKGLFRSDLFYRLNKHQIKLPPLRERLEDIEPLTEFFIEKTSAELGVSIPRMPEGLVEILKKYSFPGNIRELEGMIFDAISSPPFGKITLDYFRNNFNLKQIPEGQAPVATSISTPESVPRNADRIEDAEKMLIEKTLKEFNGNLTHAARRLGISRSTLYRKISGKNKPQN